jgi:NAD(P)H-quinone oxidoreductase subunit 5
VVDLRADGLHADAVALGLPGMALLHLVAHSLYKAHAFLSAGGAVLPLAYFGLHAAMAVVVPTAAPAAAPTALIAAVALAFAALYVLQATLSVAPRGRLAQALYPWFYGGLFLDETVSRVVFRAFPPHPENGPAQPRTPTTTGAHA